MRVVILVMLVAAYAFSIHNSYAVTQSKARQYQNSSGSKLRITTAIAKLTSQKYHIIVNLHNISEYDPVKKIRVRLSAGNSIVSKEYIPSLTTDQSRLVILPYSAQQQSPCILINYKMGNNSNSTGCPIAVPVLKHNLKDITSILPLILSPLFTLIGVFVGGYLANKRDHSRATFEWNKMLYESKEPHYRQFLSAWRRDPNVEILTKLFDEMQSECTVISDAITKQYELTCATLSINASDKKKAAACDALYKEIINDLKYK